MIGRVMIGRVNKLTLNSYKTARSYITVVLVSKILRQMKEKRYFNILCCILGTCISLQLSLDFLPEKLR